MKSNNLTEDQLNKIKKEVAEAMANVRHSLLLKFPFTGAIALRLNLKPIRDKRCRTAATDGTNLFFDCDLFSKLTDDERRFVMAHEIWHCVMIHMKRCQSRNRDLFNIASDMEVNNLLTDYSQGINMVAPEGLLFPPAKMKGKSAEEIYEWLLKQANKKNKKDSKSSSSKNDEQDSDDSNSSSSDEKYSSSKRVKGSGNLNGQFDKHKYSEDEEKESNEDPLSKDQWGEVGYDKDYNPKVDDDIAEKMREAAIAAAQQCERTKGNLPAGIRGVIEKLVHPEIKWQDLLAEFVTKCYSADNRTWLPPNRRHVYNDMYFQSRRSDVIDGIVAIDTSGSCIGDLPKFFSELKGLIESFGNYHILVIQADADVDQVDEYDGYDNPLELNTAADIKWSGGGGTDYGPVFKYIEDNMLEPKFVIYLGDGYAEMSYDKIPNYPVLWMLTKDGCEDFCNFGKKIHFKEA